MMVITAEQILQGFIKQAVPTIRNQESGIHARQVASGEHPLQVLCKT